MRVTIKDIAREVGVTHGVISRVLNGGSSTIRVSPHTAERIHAAAERLGYQPNAVARNFREHRTGMIGILHGDGFSRLRFDDGSRYFARLMDGIVDGAFQSGYTLGLSPCLVSEEAGLHLADGRFDGYVWYSSGPSPRVHQAVARYPSPIVVIHTPAAELGGEFPTVLCDNRQGMALAMAHLRSLGHTQIAFAMDLSFVFAESRIRRDHFLEIAQELGIVGSLINMSHGIEPVIAQWKEHLSITAVIAHNETLAATLMAGAQRAGMRVPDDISFVGFDSTDYCDLQSPSLTAVSQPLLDLGRTAVVRLVQLLNGEPDVPIETVLPCGLDIRNSTQFPRSSSTPCFKP